MNNKYMSLKNNIELLLDSLETRRGTLLMETVLLHNYFGNISTWDERYYFHVEGSTRDEIEPMLGEIEMNLGVPPCSWRVEEGN